MHESESESDASSSEDETLAEAALYRDLGIALPSRLARALSAKKDARAAEGSSEAQFSELKSVSTSALPTKARPSAPSHVGAAQSIVAGEVDELASDTGSPPSLVHGKSEPGKNHSFQPPLFRAGSDDDDSLRHNSPPGSRVGEGSERRDDFLEWLDDNVNAI